MFSRQQLFPSHSSSEEYRELKQAAIVALKADVFYLPSTKRQTNKGINPMVNISKTQRITSNWRNSSLSI